MRVLKRDGKFEMVSFDKVLRRIQHFCKDLEHMDPHEIAQQVCTRIYDGVPTGELDELTAQICATLSTRHPDFGKLASRIIVSNHHKNTSPSFSEAMGQLFANRDVHGEPSPLVSDELWGIVQQHREKLNAVMDYKRDFSLDYFGYKTLERSYLLKIGDTVIERPQHMWMRVALGIHAGNIKDVVETYELMSQGFYTHATPTLFNAGTPRPQLSSCFLMGLKGDSVEGLYDSVKDATMISKYAGGIGFHLHHMRSKGSRIRGTNGTSSGIVPYCRVWNEAMRHINQAGKRAGSAAFYLEPWHPDVFEFVSLRRNTGAEEERCRDLFIALWVPDLFMERVQANGEWSLMDPDECPGLPDCHGEAFRELYTRYEREGKARKVIKAQELWTEIIKSQVETGTPYMLNKDACQRSNHKGLGMIKSSNLCVAPETEILTRKGFRRIADLENEEVEVWNGCEWSETVVRKTGTNQSLFHVKFSNGEEMDCTPYHKFYTCVDGNPKKVVCMEARDLKIGMKLEKWRLPCIQGGNDDFKYAYTHGLFTAEGTYVHPDNHPEAVQCSYKNKYGDFCGFHKDQNKDELKAHYTDIPFENGRCMGVIGKKPRLSLYGVKRDLLPYLDIDTAHKVYEEKHIKKTTVFLPFDLPEKFSVPHDQTLDVKLRWFEGYADGDGCITRNGDCYSLQISCTNKEFLIRVKRMLNTMGVEPKVAMMSTAKEQLMPDGRGGHAYYMRSDCYRICITAYDLFYLKSIGFSPKRLNLDGIGTPNRDAREFVQIVALEDNGRLDDTFCFNEPKAHKGIFNGILTGNCAEILIYSDDKEYGVCNLASIVLPTYVKDGPDGKRAFDYEALHAVVKKVARNMDKVIDRNYYPVPEAKRANTLHRPVGIGFQGLADVFMMLRLPYESEGAAKVNRLIIETMYHAALEASMEISRERTERMQDGMTLDELMPEERVQAEKHPQWAGAYSSFAGSPTREGILQYDMWNVEPTPDRYDWDALKTNIKAHGLRNSLSIALMPTASTSQIMGYTESFEPITSNIYSRRTLAGEFIVICKYLIQDLLEIGMWNEDMKNRILAAQGSIQSLVEIPEAIRALYRTVWEIRQKVLIDQSADRGPFVCHTQSLNLYMADPDIKKLTNMHFYSWKKQLKSNSYYIRGRPKAQTASFAVDLKYFNKDGGNSPKAAALPLDEAIMACSRDNPGACMMCSS